MKIFSLACYSAYSNSLNVFASDGSSLREGCGITVFVLLAVKNLLKQMSYFRVVEARLVKW